MAWSFLITTQQSDMYYRRLGGKSALTTERNEAAACAAVSRNIPAADLTPASNRVSHARGTLVVALSVLGAWCFCCRAKEWHDDHSLSILATPSRRTNKAQGRMRQGGQVPPRPSPPKLQAFPSRLCFWRACACPLWTHHSNDSEIGTRCASQLVAGELACKRGRG